MRIAREVVITALIAIAAFALLQTTVQTYVIHETSMLPKLHEGEWIMVSKARYFCSDPQRGDVIVLRPPPPHDKSPNPFIKRVIGLPGETVEIKDGKVSINGTPLEEDEYIKERPNYTMPAMEIPENEYFVLGDNRNNSNDSHYGWTVPRDNIIGRAWFIYWPPGRLGIIKHYAHPEVDGASAQEAMISDSSAVQLE